MIFRLLSFYLTLYRDSKMAAAAILNILVVINWLTELLKIMVGGFEHREFIIDFTLVI